MCVKRRGKFREIYEINVLTGRTDVWTIGCCVYVCVCVILLAVVLWWSGVATKEK